MSPKRAARQEKFLAIAKTKRPEVEDFGLSNFMARPIRQIGKPRMRTMRSPKKIATGRTPEELHWRESVLARDNYRCIWCGNTEQLEADHIKPKFLYPDLKYEIDNGRTLCHQCHKTTETYGYRVKQLAGVEVTNIETFQSE